MDFQKIAIFTIDNYKNIVTYFVTSELMKKSKKTMLNWKRALESSQNAMQKARWQFFINTQPKVMPTIIANDGGRTKY